MEIQTRQQILAQDVYGKITRVKDRDQAYQKNYGRICLNFPALVYACGLCQAITFYQAKGSANSKAYILNFLDDLADTIGVEKNWAIVRKSNLIQYMRLTQQVLQAANWYKRYAEAVLKVKATEGETE